MGYLAKILMVLGLLFAPKIADALEGRAIDPLTGEGVSYAIAKLYRGDNLEDSTRADGEGYFDVDKNSVTLEDPSYKIQEDIESINLFALNGGRIAKLDKNQLKNNIPQQFDLPSGTYFLREKDGAVIDFQVIDRNYVDQNFNPLRSLQERVNELARENKRNRNTTCDSDEMYTLDVNDEETPDEIGPFFGRRLEIDDLNQENFNVEMMYNPEMESIEGMLDLLFFIEDSVINNRGTYPLTYPRTIFLDSIECYEHFEDDEIAAMYLRSGRNAMVIQRERFNMDDYIEEDPDGGLYEINNPFTAIINYTNGRSRFDPDSSIIYINDRFRLNEDSERGLTYELIHEILHFQGLDDSYDYDNTIMGVDYIYQGITEDDATTIPWRTKVQNYTDLLEFYKD